MVMDGSQVDGDIELKFSAHISIGKGFLVSAANVSEGVIEIREWAGNMYQANG